MRGHGVSVGVKGQGLVCNIGGFMGQIMVQDVLHFSLGLISCSCTVYCVCTVYSSFIYLCCTVCLAFFLFLKYFKHCLRCSV